MLPVKLVMFSTDGEKREFQLDKPRTVIGRKNNCDLRIPLPSVSRQHCEVLFDETPGARGLSLRDLGSSNGTFLNGEPVVEISLSPGDQISIGPVAFVVVIDGNPSEIHLRRDLMRLPDSDNDDHADSGSSSQDTFAVAPTRRSDSSESDDPTFAG